MMTQLDSEAIKPDREHKRNRLGLADIFYLWNRSQRQWS